MERSVSDHKFRVGQTVHFNLGRGGANGVFKVTQLLPSEDDDRRYRIKSADEPHERVARESQLARD
jgi:hypothetical protein